MNTATKDLAYFQKQVAEKYGRSDWENLIRFSYELTQSTNELYSEAAECYANYRFEQGKQEGYNEAIYHCVDISSISEDKREMLNSLKKD